MAAPIELDPMGPPPRIKTPVGNPWIHLKDAQPPTAKDPEDPDKEYYQVNSKAGKPLPVFQMTRKEQFVWHFFTKYQNNPLFRFAYLNSLWNFLPFDKILPIKDGPRIKENDQLLRLFQQTDAKAKAIYSEYFPDTEDGKKKAVIKATLALQQAAYDDTSEHDYAFNKGTLENWWTDKGKGHQPLEAIEYKPFDDYDHLAKYN
ncbi:hypothetical protein MMC24_000026 [Lignoscripta atroalba]|nr:hypothetical protein [Lignoscripta atroalba]